MLHTFLFRNPVSFIVGQLQCSIGHQTSNEPKSANVTPLFPGYRLQLASSSKHWCLQNSHLNSTNSYNSTSRSLWSVSELHFMVPLQKDKSFFQTFTCIVPRWWNDLLNPPWTAKSPKIFRKWLKSNLFHGHFTVSKNYFSAFTISFFSLWENLH